MGKRRGTLLLLTGLVSLFCWAGCGRQEGERLKDYGIYRVEGEDSMVLTQFVMDLAQEKTDIKLKNVPGDQENWISLISHEESANEYGYTVERMDDNAFTIVRNEGHLFFLARTDQGMERACRYFFGNLVEQNGDLLFPEGSVYADTGAGVKEGVWIGDVPIEEYAILCGGKEERPVGEELRDFIYETTGRAFLPVEVSGERAGKGILLSVDREAREGSITIEDGNVVIEGMDLEGLRHEMHLFVNLYLGWMNAGQKDACISNASRTIHIPSDVRQAEETWMEEREAVVTLWNVNYAGGAYLNGAVSLKNNLVDYSREQLYEYVKMLQYCGFTGIQVTEMCGAWAGTDNYEILHEKIRMMADAAHSLDMKFTLWVWGANFSDFGWVDNTAVYGAEEGAAYDNPRARETFEKYYSIYAQLADCCDRVIGHYYDPGRLHSSGDVANYARMLRDKFQAVNPGIDFGVSCWKDPFNKEVLVQVLGEDVTLYSGTFNNDLEQNMEFRQIVSELGANLGMWSWNGCEMEIDQLAQMNFNLEILRETYQTARACDEVMKPSYWSEMDSYHVLNAFSLYCAGHLLIDPDIPSEDLYRQISVAVAGEEYADAFTEMLQIIQDARSGDSADGFLWDSEAYVLKSDAYPAESILERCERTIPVLQEMIDRGMETNTFPFPIPLGDVLRMILPHLQQIRGYAQFRLELEALESAWQQRQSAEDTALALKEAAEPISDYNCVIGMWGQVEARAQRELVLEFCSRTGTEVPVYPEWDRQRKQFIYERIVSDQKGKQEPVSTAAPYYQFGYAYGEETERLIREMVEEGLLVQKEDGAVYLADWEKYIYHFD